MRKSNKQAGTVSETLRTAIEKSGLTLYRVAKNAGVGYTTLHRFMNRERSLSMEALDKLCASMRLELQPKKKL
jgi:transcriptional regulator with XRE-family HTH domain